MSNTTTTPESSSTKLRTSPAAQAFFAALDSGDTKETRQKSSSLIQKRIQSAGWRNRYSQDDYYPVRLLLSSHNSKQQQQPCSSEFRVLQVQRGELEGTYGTGATVWPASMVLLKYLEKHAFNFLQEKRVVDLGSGTGVTSIGAAVLGAAHVICTDGEHPVVQLAADNVKSATAQLWSSESSFSKESKAATAAATGPLFSVPGGGVIQVEHYWWGTGPVPGGDSLCDIVLVSDCVLPKLYPIAPLVEALDQLLQKPNAVAILSYEHRYYPDYDPRTKFKELAAAKDLVVQVVPMEEQHSVYSTDDIEIWHVQRRRRNSSS